MSFHRGHEPDPLIAVGVLVLFGVAFVVCAVVEVVKWLAGFGS